MIILLLKKFFIWLFGSDEKQSKQTVDNSSKKTYDRRRFEDDGFIRDTEDFYVEVLLRL